MRLRPFEIVRRKKDYFLCSFHQVNEHTNAYRLTFYYRYNPVRTPWHMNIDLQWIVTNNPGEVVRRWDYFSIRDWTRHKSRSKRQQIWSSKGGWCNEG